MKRKIVITGGTGFIGMALAEYLSKLDFQVILISRNIPLKSLPYKHCKWDGSSLGEWTKRLQGAFAIVNLAGRSVNCIKSPDNCDEILRSRVESTLILSQAIEQLDTPPKVWIQMSTAHIYGDPPSSICDEHSALGYGLAPDIGRAWENAFYAAPLAGVRKVAFRTSFVMGKTGGALQTMKRLVRFRMGGRVGHGKQGISWIHQNDLNKLIHEAIINPTMIGTYIATAPNPVSNAEFMKTLRETMRISFGLRQPEFLVNFGAKYVLKTDASLIIYGRYCRSSRLENEGFDFSFPDLRSAMKDLFN